MKNLTIILALLSSASLMAEAPTPSLVNGDKNITQVCTLQTPKEACESSCKVQRACPKATTKIVEKRVEVEVEKRVEVSKKNRISLLAGVGPKGNLRETEENGNRVTRTENGPVFALEYQRDILNGKDASMHLLIQGQTNRTLLLGIGAGF